MALPSVLEFCTSTSLLIAHDDSSVLNLTRLHESAHLAHSSAQSDVSLLRELNSLAQKLKNEAVDYSDPLWNTLTKVLVSLLCDFPSASSVHKMTSQLVKSVFTCDESKSILPQFIDGFKEVLFGYVDNVLLAEQQQQEGDQLEKSAHFLEHLGRVFDSFRSVLQLLNHSELSVAFLSECLASTIALEGRIKRNINSPASSESVACSSQLFVTLSNTYHQNFKLANLILLRLLSTNEWTQLTLNRGQIQTYWQSIQDTLDFAYPVGVVVEGSLAIVRLLLVDTRLGSESMANHDDLSAECLNSLVKYIDDNKVQPKLSLALISAFLLESDKSISLLLPTTNHLGLCAMIGDLINAWPCKSETQYVYFSAMLYFNWTKFVLASLQAATVDQIVEQSPLVKAIEITIQQMISFAQNYWFFNSIGQIFDSLCNCLRIMCLIRSEPALHQFLHQLYLQFYHSRNSLSVYRLLHLIRESVPCEHFEAVFKELIITQFTLQASIEHFLYHSNIPTLDSLLDDEQEESEAEQQLLATYQISNRNIDLVHFVGIRLTLMSITQMDQLSGELTDLLNDSGAKVTQKFLLKSLLPKLLTTVPVVYSIIQSMLISLVRHERIYSLQAELTIAIIQLNRQRNMHLFEDEASFLKTFISRVAIQHFDDDIRLEALTLLVEYKKSTQPITSDSLQTIFEMLISCSCIQQASARDQLSKLFRKLFARLDDSSRSPKGKATPQILTDYSDFLSRLVRWCFDRLASPTVYFGSLLTHLQLIKLFMETFQCQADSSQPRPTPLSPLCAHFSQNPIEVTDTDFESLRSMMEHSFDEIKSLSQEIIVLCHQSAIYSLKTAQIEQLSQRSTRLLALIQPQEAKTGVALCRLLMALQPEQTFGKLNQLLVELQTRVKTIKSELMSSVSSPTFPILSSIRVLICEQLNLRSLAASPENSEWKQLIGRIITECMAACVAVSPIVCNESPEGHLPMDRGVIEKGLFEGQQVDSAKQLCVTSQMLLLNGWMTIKEAVFITSYLVASFPDHHCKPSLVECETAGAVIDFLYENQLNLVHRGAFEQSSQAFNRLICSLWKHHCAQCSSKFEQIIAQIKSHLTSSTVDGQLRYKTITRRSAGLPFIIQSILSAEPTSLEGSSHGADLIRTLVEMLQPERRPQAWQVVHSLNILKALVCESRLVDAMAPWLESIIRLCVHCFDKDNYLRNLSGTSSNQMAYSIQNCSSMLFSALVTRVFGVKRNRADTSRKNRMSSLLFFQSFPSLFSFLLEQTEQAAKSSEEQQGKAKCDLSSLYPTLVILSRLTPTTSENSLFEVGRFLEPLRRIIFRCRDSRLQSLAVRAYVQLLQSATYADNFEALQHQLRRLVEDLLDSKLPVAANIMHGTGLLLAELVLQYSCHFELESAQVDLANVALLNPNERRIMESLLSIYQDSFRLLNEAALPAPVQQSLYILHSRIYSLSMVARWEGFANDMQCEAIVDSCINKTLAPEQPFTLATDQLRVAQLLDALVHCLPLEGSVFCNRVTQIVAPQNKDTLDGQLLLWSFINELLLLSVTDSSKSSGTFLLRRHHFVQETVFAREINELVCTARRFDRAALLKSSLLPLLKSGQFLGGLVGASREWSLLVNSSRGEATIQLAAVQWDIVHEISRLLYNARSLDYLDNAIHFFDQLGFDQAHLCLLQILDQVNAAENAHYSLSLLAQVCLSDDAKLKEAGRIDIAAHQMMCSHLHRLARSTSLLISRQASLQCLSTSLLTWCGTLSQSSAIWANYNSFQVICNLFASLFTLLHDEEKAIRRDAAVVVFSLVKVASVDVPTTLEKSNISSGLATAMHLAVAVLTKMLQKASHQLGAFLMLQLTVELFLEEVSEEHDEPYDDGEEPSRLFDKSKRNVYSDGQLLEHQLLIEQLATLSTSDQRWHREEGPDTPVQHLERTVRNLSQSNVPDSSLQDLLFKLHQIDSWATGHDDDDGQSRTRDESNKCQRFLAALAQAI